MKRFPALTLTGLLLTSLVALHAADPPAKKPNILIIVADDMGFSDAGCYGLNGARLSDVLARR